VLRQAQHDTECQDGEYTVTITSIDAAGNRSEATILKMIRDTLSPDTPEAGEPYICGSNICIDLTGEAGTEIIVNNQSTGVIATSTSVTLSLVEGYQSNTTYDFNVSLRDKAANISDSVNRSFTTPAIINSNTQTTSNILGTTEDKYGENAINNLSPVKIRLKVINDGKKIETLAVSYYIPSPIISFIELNNEQDKATVYGIALNKNAKATFQIDYYGKDKCEIKLPIVGCLKWGYKYEYREFESNIDHAGLKFQEQRGVTKDPEFGWMWNDKSDGRFNYTFKLNDKDNHDINLKDKIYARSYAWGDINFEIDGKNITTDIFVDESKGLESGKSNVEEIRDMLVEKLKEDMKTKIGAEIIDGTQKWTREELEWLSELFNEIPTVFFNHSKLLKVIRESNTGLACASANSAGEVRLYNDFRKKICDSSYGVKAGKDEFKVVLFHEIAHALANANIELENQFRDIAWKDSGRTNSCYSGSSTCSIFIWKTLGDGTFGGGILNRDQINEIDFVNRYAACHNDFQSGDEDCIPSMKESSTTFSNPSYPSYKEDWAESIAFYQYMRSRYENAQADSILKLKGAYLKDNIYNNE